MAPRSAKAKKAADVKVSENEVPKKGRGKGKIVEAEDEELETEVSEKAPPAVEKKKRGKKANDTEKAEETAPPAKRGRKKNVLDAEEKAVSNGDEESADEEMSAQAEDDQIEEQETEANGHAEEGQGSTGRGRKKQAKKEPAQDKAEIKSGRGRKKQEIDYDETSKDEIEEKPKAAAKGRGRPKAQPKVQSPENETEVIEEEEVKDKPITKGRKKAAGKAKAEKQEKSEQSDKEEPEEEEKELEEKPIEKPKKKEPKGRKNQAKKAAPKDEEDIEEEKDEAEKEEVTTSKRRKVAKKEEKAKVELKEDDADEEVPDLKPSKGKKVQKKAAEASTETDEEPQDTGEPTTKRRRKVAEEKAPLEDSKKKPPPKNKSLTNYEEIDFSNSSKNEIGKEWNFKISSWNVDGIRAWSSKGGLEYLKHEKPDILCLQETKCSQDKLPDEVANPPGYHAYWLAGEKDGYAGVGIYTTKLAMSVQYGLHNEEFDDEGRIITAEYEQFYLICTYVPNSGRKLVTLPKRLRWNTEFRKYVKELDKKKPVIICGDLNVSHNEIDLANPKTNRKNAGFTDEERAGMTELLGDGFIDTYRHLNPDKTAAYTFWTYMSNSRAKNVGWRLDYFIASERLLPSLCDSTIRDQVYGSDHCPISLFLHLSTADKPKE